MRNTFSLESSKYIFKHILDTLKLCGNTRDIIRGKKIHQTAVENGEHTNIYVSNTLIHMYSKCGSMLDAQMVFDGIQSPNIVAWNCLIMGYAENGQGETALDLFSRMNLAPDAATLVAALKGCINVAKNEAGTYIDGRLVKSVALEKGMSIHSRAANNFFDSDVKVASSLVDMYSKCGSMVEAQKVFDGIQNPNVVSWTCLILGYADNGEGRKALELFGRMNEGGCAPNEITFIATLKACTSLASHESGKLASLQKGMALHAQANKSCQPDVKLASGLIEMYAKCGCMVEAQKVFDEILQLDVVCWNCLIWGYVENGEASVALELLSEMRRRGFAPDSVTFAAASKACGDLGAKETGRLKLEALEAGRAIHSQSVAVNCHDMKLLSGLIEMYAKCGSMFEAREVFNAMQRHDVISWTCLILGYADNGEEKTALEVFSLMVNEGLKPDALTFVAVVKACGMLAALEIGKEVHEDIFHLGLDADLILGNCLVDFYGKCGTVVDARIVFDSLAAKDLVTWNSMLAAYGRQGDSESVFRLFDKMRGEHLQPDGTTFSCVLAACSHAGLVEKGKEFFEQMSSVYGVQPDIGHYNSMVDIFLRAHELDQALALVKDMPFAPDSVTAMTILSLTRVSIIMGKNSNIRV